MANHVNLHPVQGQDANTKSITGIRRIESQRNNLIADYALFRGALKCLDNLDETKWPTLELKDMFRKPTKKHRSPGDSRVLEGSLWGMTNAGHSSWVATNASTQLSGYEMAKNLEELNSSVGEDPTFDTRNLEYTDVYALSEVDTGILPRAELAFKKTPEILEHAEKPGVNTDGWIWTAGQLTNMSLKEIELWEDTSMFLLGC
ncbi:hypothetical protein BDP27DRAFT_1371194 [Rhodocollybia butyracea]|uniref:Uncharacterized protein n=1 Tax=Rhodocollybia butyracea TaxID=206335 RepID=A0A9P5PAQ8_9AGAR|nr:hypothetical protein BDP27DRAFT_1371194 [Rhodocollybia butyracea]